MTITINRHNIDAIFGDAPAKTRPSPPVGTGEPAAPTGPASFSIFARPPRRRPGEARRATVRARRAP